MVLVIVFFFKQKTAYEMRISDWSSDVCSSDLRYPAITDVAVVAMPHERLGEGVCAYVIADAPVSVADIGSFLGEQGLARQKWPERVEMVDAFPRTASGKVQKNILRDRLVAQAGPTEASL